MTSLLEFDVCLVELDYRPELTANKKKRRKESKKKLTSPTPKNPLYLDSMCDLDAVSICPSLIKDKL